MARKSPQKRYADAVHLIARRAGVSYRTAQRIYRIDRAETESAKYPTYWRKQSAVDIATLRKEVTSNVYDLRGEDRPFAFDVKDRQEGKDADTALRESGLQRIAAGEVTFTVIVDGEKRTITKTLQDVSVQRDKFWYAVHAAAREVLEDAIAEGFDYDAISIVLDSVSVV